jgi:hypothetical protein
VESVRLEHMKGVTKSNIFDLDTKCCHVRYILFKFQKVLPSRTYSTLATQPLIKSNAYSIGFFIQRLGFR